MKTISKIITVVVAFIVTFNFTFANESKYNLSLTNINCLSEKSLEFDIYLMNLSVGKEELKYSLGQYFLDFNPEIANGGVLTYTIVESALPEAMRPRNSSVSGNQLRLACNIISSNKAALPEISNKSPGLLIARMRLETSADKFADDKLNLRWSPGSLKTKIFIFDGKNNIEITNIESHSIEGTSDNGNNKIITIIPKEYSLSQNYPNPFNPATSIKYDIPSASFVTLKIYDITGRVIASLVNEKQEAGRYSATFTASNLSSGMYFYKLTAGGYSQKDSNKTFNSNYSYNFIKFKIKLK
jgi:hypothetical protein